VQGPGAVPGDGEQQGRPLRPLLIRGKGQLGHRQRVRFYTTNLNISLWSFATAALWVRIQTSLKNTKRASYAKEWPTHASPPKKSTKKVYGHFDKHLFSDLPFRKVV
jgi:hypothetical protein